MKVTLTSLEEISARVEATRAEHRRHFPGDREERQPVHTVYVPADRFTATTSRDFGAEAARLLDAYAPDAESLGTVFGIEPGLARTVRERVVAKLAREPIEDVRIDFEDGYGSRLDVEEDAHVAQAIEAVAIAYETGALPYYWGLRIKSFADGGHERGMRTLDGFLTGLRDRLGRLPGGFVITFPKVVMAEHVAAFVDYLGLLEDSLGLPAGQLRFEVQVETTEAIVDADGGVGLRGIVRAGDGRISGAHFGVYDYTAACGLPPAAQRLDHPACDFARHVMQVTLAGTGVRLSDGSTNIVPAGESAAQVHEAWRLHAAHVGHSLGHGFRQGWDLHAAHLPSRYAMVYADLLAGIDDVIARVRAWKKAPASGGGRSGVLDEPATIATLTARLRRAADCGAIDPATVADLLGGDRGGDAAAAGLAGTAAPPPVSGPAASDPPTGDPTAAATSAASPATGSGIPAAPAVSPPPPAAPPTLSPPPPVPAPPPRSGPIPEPPLPPTLAAAPPPPISPGESPMPPPPLSPLSERLAAPNPPDPSGTPATSAAEGLSGTSYPPVPSGPPALPGTPLPPLPDDLADPAERSGPAGPDADAADPDSGPPRIPPDRY